MGYLRHFLFVLYGVLKLNVVSSFDLNLLNDDDDEDESLVSNNLFIDVDDIDDNEEEEEVESLLLNKRRLALASNVSCSNESWLDVLANDDVIIKLSVDTHNEL